MPAVPLDEAGKFVAGAYGVFVGLILIYVAIMAAKLVRIEREVRSLAGLAEERLGVEEARTREAEPPTRGIAPQTPTEPSERGP